MKNQINEIGKDVIELQIRALKKLKHSINNSFHDAVQAIIKCQSKVIVCGVGKSGIIASKISATLSSVGTPSFSISASDCSHGDLGRITKKDILILISYSGNTAELKNIIKYAKSNKILLIGIVSNKDSNLYKSSNIKLLIPEVKESGYGIVPTSSTTSQLSIGDALSIALMEKRNFGKLDFKKFHPSGNLATKLKTVEDLMIKGNKIPFIDENSTMKNALKILSKKNLGVLIIRNKIKKTIGVITDGDLKRAIEKNNDIKDIKLNKIMTKNPISIDQNELAAKALSLMTSNKKITSLCVYKNKKKNQTVGLIHIHNILNANIN